jgi:Arabinose efflux permease
MGTLRKNDHKANYKYTAILCYIGAFMGPFGGNVVNILVPRLQKEFQVSFYKVSLTISVYMIAFASFQLISGLVSDIYGRRRVILLGYGVFGIGCIICYLTRNINIFLAGRFIQGMSNAFMTPVLMAVLGDIVPKKSLGKYMGVFGSVQTSGIFLAPVMGGFFAEINWRYVFLILSVLSVLLTIIYYMTFTYSSRVYKRDLMPWAMFANLLKNKAIILLALSSFAGYFGFGSLGFLFAKYIYLNVGVSERINGIIVSMTGMASIIFSPMAGRLTDKHSRPVICICGILPIIPLIFSIPYIKNPYLLSIDLFIMGAFSAAVWSSLNTMAVDTVPEMRGAISSIVNSFKYFSFSISPIFYGLLYEKSGIGTAFKAASLVTLTQLLIMYLYFRMFKHKKSVIPA